MAENKREIQTDSLRKCPKCKYTTNIYTVRCPNDQSMLYMEHAVKTWPEFFAAARDGLKPFEYRRNDRQYQVGETLRLLEWDPKVKAFTGNEITRRITYVLAGHGIQEGFCILGVMPVVGPGLRNAQALDFIKKWEDDDATDMNIANIMRLCAILEGRPEGGYIPGRGIKESTALPVEPASLDAKAGSHVERQGFFSGEDWQLKPSQIAKIGTLFDEVERQGATITAVLDVLKKLQDAPTDTWSSADCDSLGEAIELLEWDGRTRKVGTELERLKALLGQVHVLALAEPESDLRIIELTQEFGQAAPPGKAMFSLLRQQEIKGEEEMAERAAEEPTEDDDF